MRPALKTIGRSLKAQNEAAELRLRAERALGELLGQSRSKGGRPSKNAARDEPSLRREARAIDLKWPKAKRCLAVAAVPKSVFEDYIRETKLRDRELTWTGATRRKVASAGQRRTDRESWEASGFSDDVKRMFDDAKTLTIDDVAAAMRSAFRDWVRSNDEFKNILRDLARQQPRSERGVVVISVSMNWETRETIYNRFGRSVWFQIKDEYEASDPKTRALVGWFQKIVGVDG